MVGEEVGGNPDDEEVGDMCADSSVASFPMLGELDKLFCTIFAILAAVCDW